MGVRTDYFDDLTLEIDTPQANTPLLALGRAIFGGYFLYNGIQHFRNVDAMAGYAASKGVPQPKAAVMGAGALLIAGGLSLISGIKPKIGAAFIEAFLIGVSPKMHAFWREGGPERQADQVNFLKNVALAGGALLAASIPEPWPGSLSHGRS